MADVATPDHKILKLVEDCSTTLERLHKSASGDARIAYLHYLIGVAAKEATKRADSLKRGQSSQWP